MESKFQQREPRKAGTDRPNLTGIPTQMKLDFEQRSGMSFDDVRVHYNSEKPAQFHALAYTQGAQIYIGPGQERSLPHELGHVIQQKAGRVRPTRWVRGQPVNDRPELEREADRAPVQCMPAPALRGVIQMVDVPVLRAQKGQNCGYHALARAICSLHDFTNEEKDNLEVKLTTYAIEHGYSAIGEAFDPHILAQVGVEFCGNNNIPIVFTVIDYNCDPPSPGMQEDIQKDMQSRLDNNNSVLLVPYFPYINSSSDEEKSKNNWKPVMNNDNEENAHWCVIQKGDGDGRVKLYEGNRFGSTNFAGNTEDALKVTLGELIQSNMSIKDKFNWDTFRKKKARPTEQDLYFEAMRLRSINMWEAAVNTARKAFLTSADLDKRLNRVMDKINEYSWLSPFNHIQNVHLKGHVIEVKRRG